MKRAVWVPLLILSLFVWCSGCDTTGYGQRLWGADDDAADGDEPASDGDENPADGDEPVSGGGSLDDPFVLEGASMTGSGSVADLSASIDASTAQAPSARMKTVDGDVDGDTDGDAADGDEADGDATDGDATDGDATDGDATDGDATDGDAADGDAVLDGDAPDGDAVDGDAADGEVASDMGLGPEVVVKVDLLTGDELKVSWSGADFDGVLYILDGNTTNAHLLLFVDKNAAGQAESLSYVATGNMTVYVILDTKAGASGDYSFEIERISAEGGNPPEDGKVGAACAENEECDTNFCLTSEFLKPLLGTDVPIPGGYCSTVDLMTEACSPECNEDNGGFCISGGFMGPDYSIVNLCLRPCEVNGDCRVEDTNVCKNPQEWVDEGLIDQSVVDEYFDNNSFCIPQGFLDIMQEELEYQASL